MNDITKAKIKGFILGILAFNGLGAVAHLVACGEHSFSADYSIKNRFECAYNFNTPNSHKYYSVCGAPGWECMDDKESYYFASPYATYPALLVFGLIGARIAAKRHNKNKIRMRQFDNGRFIR